MSNIYETLNDKSFPSKTKRQTKFCEFSFSLYLLLKAVYILAIANQKTKYNQSIVRFQSYFTQNNFFSEFKNLL